MRREFMVLLLASACDDASTTARPLPTLADAALDSRDATPGNAGPYCGPTAQGMCASLHGCGTFSDFTSSFCKQGAPNVFTARCGNYDVGYFGSFYGAEVGEASYYDSVSGAFVAEIVYDPPTSNLAAVVYCFAGQADFVQPSACGAKVPLSCPDAGADSGIDAGADGAGDAPADALHE